MLNRYGITVEEQYDFCDKISECNWFDQVRHTLIDKLQYKGDTRMFGYVVKIKGVWELNAQRKANRQKYNIISLNNHDRTTCVDRYGRFIRENIS